MRFGWRLVAVVGCWVSGMVVVVPLAYAIGVAISGYEDDPAINIDPLDVASEEVYAVALALGFAWLVCALWITARLSNRAAAPHH